MRTLLALLAALALMLTGCSDDDTDEGGDDTGSASASAPADADAADDDAADDDAADDAGETETDDTDAGEVTFDTEGFKAYLDANLPDSGFSSEVSLLSEGEDVVQVNTQTSFWEPEDAVALCEAVADFLDATGNTSGRIDIVSTNGSDLANRSAADAACEVGADL